MSGVDDRTSGNGMQEELLRAIRALRRLRREELRLLRRIELALRGASAEEGAAGETPDEPRDPLPDWVGQEVDSVLSRAFDAGVSWTDDPKDAEDVPPADGPPEVIRDPGHPASYLLLGSAHEWVGFPWSAVERVELAGESTGLGSGPSLRHILDQTETTGVPEPFCIRFAGGTGTLVCQSVGGVVTLEEASGRGVECLLMPEISGANGSVRLLLQPLVEIAALETHDTPAGNPAGTSPEGGASGIAQADPVSPTQRSRTVAPTGLVAIRYLPARVSITRALRSRGWFLRETAELADAVSRLGKVRYQAAFIEMVEDEVPDLIPAIQAAVANGCRVIAVGSRLRGRACDPPGGLGEIPRLLYPFHESEVERVLDRLRQDTGN